MEEVKRKKSALYYVALVGLPLLVFCVLYITYNFYSNNKEEQEMNYQVNLFILHDSIESEVSKFKDINNRYKEVMPNYERNIGGAKNISIQLEGSELFNDLEINYITITNGIAKINTPPKKFKKMYSELVALESVYSEFYEYIIKLPDIWPNKYVKRNEYYLSNYNEQDLQVLVERAEILK